MKLSPTQKLILKNLTWLELTVNELTQRVHVSRQRIQHALNGLHYRNKVSIVKWTKYGTGDYVAVWGLDTSGKHAERPKLTREEAEANTAESKRKHKAKKKALREAYTPQTPKVFPWAQLLGVPNGNQTGNI